MTHGSLFSGIGGFDLGAERAGLQNLWACEIDEFKQQILHKHFPDTQIYSDIKTINPPYVDVISGGFPCQDISLSQGKFKNNRYGNYGIKGEKSGLWSEYARVIRHVRPKYVIIENSAMLPVRGLEVVLCDLATAGYDAEWQTLSAKAFGFPHLRKRCFVVAYPCKADSLVVVDTLRTLKNYYKAKHQKKLLYLCRLHGISLKETTNIYEKIMGFCENYTDVGLPPVETL